MAIATICWDITAHSLWLQREATHKPGLAPARVLPTPCQRPIEIRYARWLSIARGACHRRSYVQFIHRLLQSEISAGREQAKSRPCRVRRRPVSSQGLAWRHRSSATAVTDWLA
jgi:hypothetical protein